MKTTLPALVLAVLTVLGAEELQTRSWSGELGICTSRVVRHVVDDVWVTSAEVLHLPKWVQRGVRGSLDRALRSPAQCAKAERSSRPHCAAS
jgi:hypothetical protein